MRVANKSICCFLLLMVRQCWSAISSMNYVPMGSNPTLYTPGYDPIMHLDQMTFSDTIFGQDHAFFVEFYADWCGHCRAFAPYFLEFANLVYGWTDLVTVAAINCADPFNSAICRENGIDYYPRLKYFPRQSRQISNAIFMDAIHSATQLRDQLSRAVVNEYSQYQYPDWPIFNHIYVDSSTTYGHLWQGTPDSADYLAIIFEQFDSVSGQFLLEMNRRKRDMGARRALSNSPLVSMLQITVFPYVAVFKRDRQQAIYMKPYGSHTYADMDNILMSDQFRSLHFQVTTPRPTTIASTHAPTIDCGKSPERCRELYYVSETDMLKAVHTALYSEVLDNGEQISGDNLTALYNFVDLLANHFPVLSFSSSNTRSDNRISSSVLKYSERARLVFQHLRSFLETRLRSNLVSAREWQNQFQSIERVYANPFPVNASWQHCKGSSSEYRGYTCGLWTTFHALTVHTYLDTIKNDKIDVLKPLKSIQGWVDKFFGCQHCRNHFMNMTTYIFPLNNKRIRHSHDMMLYLWRAHNIVNGRLHGDITEDPQFQKFQFPALFLCPMCHTGGQFSRRQIRTFLLRYYGTIKPHNRLERRVLHFS